MKTPESRLNQRAGLQKVSAYSMMCAGFLAAEEAQGQISYTDLDPDVFVDGTGFPAFYELDLDGNGSIDFRVNGVYYYGLYDNVKVTPLGSNEIVGVGASGGFSYCFGPFAADLPVGSVIDSSDDWRTDPLFLRCDGGGPWGTGETAYLGLRVADGADFKYGWLRVTLNSDLSATVQDYAIEETPGSSIEAGDQGACPVPGSLQTVSTTPNSVEITWDDAPSPLSYDVFYRPAAGGPVQSMNVANPPAVIADLDQNTLYNYSVRAVCPSSTTGFASIQTVGVSDIPPIVETRKLSELTPGFPMSPPDGLDNFAGLGKEGVVRLGDVEGDGTEEFLVGSTWSSILGINGGLRWVSYDNAGNLTTVKRIDLGPDDVRSARAIGDLDGNGVGDVAFLDDNMAWTMLMSPDTAGLSAVQLMDGPMPIMAEELGSLGDFDGDSIPDVFVRDGFSSPVITILTLNADGSLKNQISVDLTGTSVSGAWFEQADGIGDVDGNGVPDLAIGDGFDSEDAGQAGAVYVVLMNSDATVSSVQKINQSNSGNWLKSTSDDLFGRSVAGIGDIDGDGVPDLLVGSEQDNDPTVDAGSAWIITLNNDGSLKAARKIADGTNGLNLGLDTDDRFSESLGLIGDSDGDGLMEFGIGAPRDDDGSSNKGALYILEFDKPACPRPENTRLDALSSSSVTVAWDPVDEATLYRIEGRRVGAATQAGNTAATTFTRGGLQANRDYEWRVRSICGTLASGWTDFFQFTTPVLRNGELVAADISPNPASDYLQVRGLDGQLSVRILNLQGALMQSANGSSQGGQGLYIALDDLPAGVYMVEVRNDEGEFAQSKLIVQ